MRNDRDKTLSIIIDQTPLVMSAIQVLGIALSLITFLNGFQEIYEQPSDHSGERASILQILKWG
jgi:hypothetical protein